MTATSAEWRAPTAPPLLRRPRVAVAGHDLKFFGRMMSHLRGAGADLVEDRWGSARKHDEGRSREVLAWAEVIICEWCLGNAVWYARHKRPEQRLLVHFHRFEYETEFPGQVEADRVDAFVFVGRHFLEAARERFGWPAQRCVYVPNDVDVAGFTKPKRDGAAFTLGLLGWHRKLKRLDLALDMLERLRGHDPRFRLRVKGTPPRDHHWVWNDDDERTFFERQFARLEQTEALRDAVVFDEFGEDVADWFQDVGFVLSPSDVESFHLAAMEGMASEAVPVVRDRPGVHDLYPPEWIFDGVDDAVTYIVATAGDGTWREQGRRARAHVERFDVRHVGDAWERLALD